MANDTVAEIVAMLRRFAKGEELPTDEIPSFTSLANSIEAAHKREIAEKDAEIEKLRALVDKAREVCRA